MFLFNCSLYSTYYQSLSLACLRDCLTLGKYKSSSWWSFSNNVLYRSFTLISPSGFIFSFMVDYHSHSLFFLFSAAILDFQGSIKVKFKFWHQKWNPWPKKWYISCITHRYCIKTVQIRISHFRGELRFMATPKMT